MYHFIRDPVGIRTQDPQLRRLLLYPAELPDHPFGIHFAEFRLQSYEKFSKLVQDYLRYFYYCFWYGF